MRSLQGKLILLAASAAFAIVYMALRGRPFAIETALCFSYTVLFFGHALRSGGLRRLTANGHRHLTSILLAHTICLAVLVAIFNLSNAVMPWLPYQLTQPLANMPSGRPGPPAFRAVELLLITFLCWCELRWFRSRPAETSRTRPSVWSLLQQKDHDLERMKRLHLHSR